jgi:hypothetical protein
MDGQDNANSQLKIIYKKRKEIWSDFERNFLPTDAKLMGVSSCSSNQRIYAIESRIYKVHRVGVEAYPRMLSLKGEYDVLLYISRSPELDLHPLFKAFNNEWEVLELDNCKGETLLEKEQNNTFIEISLWPTWKIVWNLTKLGIAHRDLKMDHIIYKSHHRAMIIDFDQAERTSWLNAFLSNMFAVGKSKGFGFPMFWLFVYYHTMKRDLLGLFFIIFKRVLSYTNRFRRALFLNKTEEKQIKNSIPYAVTANLENEIKLLKRAWELGAESDANAPGANRAYYSFDIGGCLFTGERPWELRWEHIRRKINFNGKRVLELGCNLGLLSTFARIEGAACCSAVDIDDMILRGARLVAAAFGINDNRYVQLDFDSSVNWEAKLGGNDLVMCLSVLNWVKDKKRLLDFLGQHNELLFEGHECLEIEIERLRSIGYNHIEILMNTERGRRIIYAQKT